MKVSIINNQPIYGIDYSNRADCTEVFEIEDKEFPKVQNKSHKLEKIKDKKKKKDVWELVEVPVVEEIEEEITE